MNQDFNNGRIYERKEILTIIETLKEVDDITQMRSLLESWQIEILYSSPKIKIYESTTSTTV